MAYRYYSPPTKSHVTLLKNALKLATASERTCLNSPRLVKGLMIESLSHPVSIVASMAAITAPSAALAGLAPRIGPLRAVVLALSSRFSRAQDQSQRAAELRALRSTLSATQRDQYVVVSGPKGVGKTCLVDTALQFSFGVVSVRVAAGAAEKDILADAFKAVSRSTFSFLDHSASARRVLWWHHFLFRVPATVVLRASERKATQQYADIDSAARSLAHDFGARVLVDASNNSLPDAATATKREDVLELESMPRSLLEELPELQPLLGALEAAGLADVAWMLIGGNPADYKGLLRKWDAREREDIALVVAAFVQNLVGKALDNVHSAIAGNKRLEGLFAQFRTTDEVPSAFLASNELVRPSLDKVLRVVLQRHRDRSGQRVLVPADAATAFVLRSGVSAVPFFEELRAAAALGFRRDHAPGAISLAPAAGGTALSSETPLVAAQRETGSLTSDAPPARSPQPWSEL